MLIGATSDPAKLGYGVAANLRMFPGPVHYLGREAGVMFDTPIVTSLDEIPDPVDLAILLIPAGSVPGVLEDCGRRGIRSAVIASGGFREIGGAGVEIEAASVEIAKRYGIRLLGPNCIGVIDTHVPLDTTFLTPSGAPEGSIAFLSHSGALCAAVIDWARDEGFGFSRIVSLGNQADLTETDLLPEVASDPETAAIAMYLEGIGDGRRFVEVAEGIGVPIVVLKAGRFDAGRDAAASHTGALAGGEAAFDAAFRRAGVVRASSTKEMFDWARTLETVSPMHGTHVAVVTNAGGPGVLAADAVEENGLEMAYLSEETLHELRNLLPPVAGLGNPVDMLASAGPDTYARTLALVLADDNVDAAIVIVPPPPRSRTEDVVDAVVLVKTGKPVLLVLMGGPETSGAVRHALAAGVPWFRFPGEAAGALGALYRHSSWERHSRSSPVMAGPCDMPDVDGWLDQESALAVIQAAGVAAVPTIFASDAAGAVAAASSMGYPVVVKADVEGLIHKSRAGGVAIGLRNEDEVRQEMAGMTARLDSLRGVVVQSMIDHDDEVVVGAIRDARFGALVMFGSGGVDVERTSDVAFALAPITREDISYLFDQTEAGRRLSPIQRDLVSDVIVRVGVFADAYSEIRELEINPLVVSEDHVIAVDARVLRSGALG